MPRDKRQQQETFTYNLIKKKDWLQTASNTMRFYACGNQRAVLIMLCLVTLLHVTSLFVNIRSLWDRAPPQAGFIAQPTLDVLTRSQTLRQHVRNACKALAFKESMKQSVKLPYLLYDDKHKAIYCYIPKFISGTDALEEVLKGGFSLIAYENHISIIIASNYTDGRGLTPFYVSKHSFTIMATFGWALRKGAPFFTPFQMLFRRLEDAGILSQWQKEVMAQRVRENRKKKGQQRLSNVVVNKRQVVLGLAHLQGAFYLLFSGIGIALLAFLCKERRRPHN